MTIGTTRSAEHPDDTRFGFSHGERRAVLEVDRVTKTYPSRQATLGLFCDLHDQGVTIVVITHDHGVAARMSRRIEMLDGRVVLDTVHDASSPPGALEPGRSPFGHGTPP